MTETTSQLDMSYDMFTHNIRNGLEFRRTAIALGDQALIQSSQHEIAGLCGQYPQHMQTLQAERLGTR